MTLKYKESNILSIDQTEFIKTFFDQIHYKKLDVPFEIEEETILNKAKYIGEGVVNILLILIQTNDYNIGKVLSLIFFNEIDKIVSKNSLNIRDVISKGVHQTLLKKIDGLTTSFLSIDVESFLIKNSFKFLPHKFYLFVVGAKEG